MAYHRPRTSSVGLEELLSFQDLSVPCWMAAASAYIAEDRSCSYSAAAIVVVGLGAVAPLVVASSLDSYPFAAWPSAAGKLGLDSPVSGLGESDPATSVVPSVIEELQAGFTMAATSS